MEERIIVECLRERRPLPKRIAAAPALPLGLASYMTAFYELSTCRGGMGGPIPWTAINEYALRHGWYGEDFEDLVYMIRALDSVVLEREAASRPTT